MLLPNPHRYCPSCSGATNFERSTECCDGTAFDFRQCGVSGPPRTVEQSINPGGPNRPAQPGLQCLIHDPQQDTLLGVSSANNGPLQVQPGPFSQARYNVAPESLISTSDSIITVPLFDAPTWPPPTQLPIVGFLQLFVNNVGGPGRTDMNATILNVVGCGLPLAPGSAVSGGGASAIPVRLIHN